MLESAWHVTQQRHGDRLVLRIPSRVPRMALVTSFLFMLLWPVGGLLVAPPAVALVRHVTENRLVLLSVLLIVPILWALPSLRVAYLMVYWFRAVETITIRPGSVEIERGFWRFMHRESYTGIKSKSWRVSPWRHHVRDCYGAGMGIAFDGPSRPGGALTFTHGRRAVRCGRNFGTRKAKKILPIIQEFLASAEPSG